MPEWATARSTPSPKCPFGTPLDLTTLPAYVRATVLAVLEYSHSMPLFANMGLPLLSLASSLGPRAPLALVPNGDAKKGENHSPRPTIPCGYLKAVAP